MREASPVRNNFADHNGLQGRFRLIKGERRQEYEEFRDGVLADLKPEGTVEKYFANLWIENSWNLARLDRIAATITFEAGSVKNMSTDDLLTAIERLHVMSMHIFDRAPQIEKYFLTSGKAPANERNRQDDPPDPRESARWADGMRVLSEGSDLMNVLKVYAKELSDRMLAPAAAPPSSNDTADYLAQAFKRNRDHIALLLRYRTKIERSRDNALHELQRLQAARQGREMSAPQVLDVNIQSDSRGD